MKPATILIILIISLTILTGCMRYTNTNATHTSNNNIVQQENTSNNVTNNVGNTESQNAVEEKPPMPPE